MEAGEEGFAGKKAFQLRSLRVSADSRGDPERVNRAFWRGRARAKWGFWSFLRFVGGEKWRQTKK